MPTAQLTFEAFAELYCTRQDCTPEALRDRLRGLKIRFHRLCIVEALNRWQAETSKPRTPEDVENYNRPCGE